MAGDVPPIRGITQSFFTNVAGASRNGDGTLTIGGNTYYAFYGSTDWLLDKAVNQTLALRARFTSAAFDAIKNGSYQSANMLVQYNSKNYKFVPAQDPGDADKVLFDLKEV